MESLSTTLLERLRASEPAAWERLAYLFGPVVAAWCRRQGVTADDVDDVVQEVFASCARGLPGFRRDREGDSFRAWLATITRNKVRDYQRRAQRQIAAVGGSEQHARLQEVAVEPDPASTADTPPDERRQLIQRASELVRCEFEERTWEAFRITTTEGVSPSEAAERIGLSINSVYKARSRVMRRLRDELEGLL